MKPLRHFFSRALGACKPGRGKAGSSLALVMMVGAALVIWVMCIMPLMATTGATAAKTEQSYDDYLDSRSSIEYCKSELQDIVTREMPYTFAVIRNTDADGKISYSAVRKMEKNGAGSLSEYTTRITSISSDDMQDEPNDTDGGKQVAAICAVGKDENGVYPITIKTYHNGEKGQSYSLSFTVSGSLLIFPESYKQNDALPLSDFAVVDGKMGANQVWNSTINMGIAVDSSTGGSGSFTETLLPWKLEPDANYANTKEYPAAFKKTANAAEYSEGGLGDPIIEAPFTDQNWVMPTAVSGPGNKPGEIWYKCDDGTNISVHLYKDDNHKDENITEFCTIYLNGVERKDKTVPAQEGYYCITVDYNGTGAYDPSENAVNILPASGLRMPYVLNALETVKEKQAKPGTHSFDVKRIAGPVNYTYDVTLTPESDSVEEGILYACCNGTETPVDGKIPLTWSESPTFTGLNADETWYFYACRPAEIKAVDADGVTVTRFYEDSEPTCLGAVCPAEYATSLESGTAYAIVGESGDKSYVMNANRDPDPLNIGNGFMVVPSGDSSSIPTWTAEGNENQWTLKNGDENNGYKYLNLNGEYVHTSLFSGYWNLRLETSPNPTTLTINFNDSDASDASVQKKVQWTGIISSRETDAYLAFSGTSFTAQQGYSTVKFLKVPNVGSAPSVTSPSDYRLVDDEMKDGFVLDYKAPSVAYVGKHISPEATLETLYANGQAVTKLDPGVYYLTAKLEVGKKEDGTAIYRYADLGMLTILKSTDNSAPDLTINQSEEDDLTVTVKTTAPAYGSDNNRNMLLFGYKTPNEKDFHWYPADKDNKQNRTFRLEPGAYDFAVCRFGDSTYEAVTTEVTYPVEFTEIELPQDWGSQFEYTYNEETGEIVYYRHLPDKVTPSRIQLVFGYEDDNDKISWHTERNDNIEIKDTIFGLIVTKSKNYGDMEHVLLKRPYGINNLNGHTDSIMRGSSLYFMGRDNSINTYGNSVYLYADLVVLNSPIALGPDEKGNLTGHVYVEPYSKDKDAVLFFNASKASIVCQNGFEFKPRTFYKIPRRDPSSTNSIPDLCNPNPTGVTELGSVEKQEVKDLFRLGVYPEINLDIAYASDEQLAHVVSSETIGWTNKGVLSGQNTTDTNAGYVVCAYVSEINNATSFKANRVLIAAKRASDDYTLNVPASLTFITRYLSIDADQVIGASGAKLTVNNLGQDDDFLSWLGNVTGLTPYHSKTLQVDFERTTKIFVPGVKDSEVKRQICRYDHGANLFGNVEPQSLMVTYTTSEVKRWFNIVSTSAKTVDRYVTLKSDSGSSLDISAFGNCKLNIYANYIYMDPSITSIRLKSLLGEGDITINSQEKGYNDKEYLGLFTDNSAESYSGTLLYFQNKVNVTLGWGNNYEIKPGFYHIKAEQSGISIKELAENAEQYKVSEDDLKSLSVYIKKDGSISNAYVDTGIWTNTNTGLGGFSGGNVG